MPHEGSREKLAKKRITNRCRMGYLWVEVPGTIPRPLVESLPEIMDDVIQMRGPRGYLRRVYLKSPPGDGPAYSYVVDDYGNLRRVAPEMVPLDGQWKKIVSRKQTGKPDCLAEIRMEDDPMEPIARSEDDFDSEEVIRRAVETYREVWNQPNYYKARGQAKERIVDRYREWHGQYDYPVQTVIRHAWDMGPAIPYGALATLVSKNWFEAIILNYLSREDPEEVERYA